MIGAPFFGDEDRKLFLATVEEMVKQFGVRVHACCLMPDHYHIVVGTPRGNLSAAVRWLQLTYTMRLNARHRRSGPLFQGQCKPVLVEAYQYGRLLVECVHLNPVWLARRKSGSVRPLVAERAVELDGFEWSSHQDYAGWREKPVEWLCLDCVLGTERSVAQAAYWAEIRQEGRRINGNGYGVV